MVPQRERKGNLSEEMTEKCPRMMKAIIYKTQIQQTETG